MAQEQTEPRTGWGATISKLSIGAILMLAVSGLFVTFGSFSAAVEWTLLLHTLVGVLLLLPIAWYGWIHWKDYKHYQMSDIVLLGYLAAAALLLCLVSGVVVTWQGLFGLRMSPLWRNLHLYSTYAVLVTGLPHVVVLFFRIRKKRAAGFARAVAGHSAAWILVAVGVVAILSVAYPGQEYVNAFPADYNFLYGEDRPFAPSLAVTDSGGAFDSESLAGSMTCGTANCHSQILEEWTPSAHRYAAMDPLFQKVQSVMAEQNGPESTRYCGGCHDPISLFSGTKNLFVENLTDLHGYQEGVSCLVCHGVHETDLQGNANYVMTQPPTYLWQWQEEGAGKFLSDFLIRTYPDQHNLLSKRMFKAPEYCAACHKQFIDQEVNRVGWVQLQNQYDNWKASHWYTEGDPEKTIECRECHMPLVASTDPSAGDAADYNRSPDDGKHRSHRFIAANSMVPALLKLDGWEKQIEMTESWLAGTFEIPEIDHKWSKGPVVQLAVETPETVQLGEKLPIRVVMTANKVGHDFPTGPLDIIQSWVEMRVTDHNGDEVYSTGTRDEKHFIEPGSFLFKAEPVDQYGNLIDRHNLWEMVGVRYRRALFPGYSDSVEYVVDCPSTMSPAEGEAGGWRDRAVEEFEVPAAAVAGELTVDVRLMYRKVDQFLINFLLGEDSGLTAPVVEMVRTTVKIPVVDTRQAELSDTAAPRIGG
ncbi:MAG: cytochrome c family protein [Acidobacteriota bacterium]|nr:cytochrome c family protein [Acidobacteriota bacterium]